MTHPRIGPLKALGAVDPVALADLMLMVPLLGTVTLATLEPGQESAVLVLEGAGLVLDAFAVPHEIATAACARLAIAAKLDPLADAGTPEGLANVAKVSVRASQHTGELLVTIVARGDGLEAEVRTLSVNGLTPSVTRSVLKRCTVCAAYQPAQRTSCEHDGGALADVLDCPEPGGTIGQYVVGALLGEGGSAVVYRGHHAVIGKPVAIKLLHRSFGGDPATARRFIAEARAASRLRHPNIVEVTDYGLLANERPYTVMEYVEGVTLLERLHTGDMLDVASALRITREIAAALGVAHAAGIVHNDLKPGNVMLLEGTTDEAPRVKVFDFDAASQLGKVQDPDTLIIYGTAPYMSPELAWGQPTDARSDIYTLGIMLYELLTGDVPFDGKDVQEVLRKHSFAPVPPLRRVGMTFPVSVTTLISRCLRKLADERPQSAAEVISELDRAIEVVSRPFWKRWIR